MVNVAAKRQSTSVYDRAEYWLTNYSWVNPEQCELLQELAQEIAAERERVERLEETLRREVTGGDAD